MIVEAEEKQLAKYIISSFKKVIRAFKNTTCKTIIRD